MPDNNDRKGIFKSRKLNGWLWRIIIAAASFLFGTGVAWGSFKAQLNDIQECITDHETRLRTIEDFVPRADEKLKTLDKIDRNVEEIKDKIK